LDSNALPETKLKLIESEDFYKAALNRYKLLFVGECNLGDIYLIKQWDCSHEIFVTFFLDSVYLFSEIAYAVYLIPERYVRE